MESPILEKIHTTLDKIEELKAVERHYDSTKQSLQEAENNLEKLNKQLDKELKDIEKLEGMSVKSLFHSVLGSKEEQLEKERQEYLQLTLKHKEYVKDIEVLEFELGLLDKKMGQIAALEKDLEKLKKDRENEIMRQPSHLRQKLMHIHSEQDNSRRRSAEIGQAIKAGSNALRSIQYVIDQLGQAKKWGDWDQMSKSRRYDRMKHSAIDKAINQAYHAKHQLNIFTKEMKDVGINIGRIDLHIESFGGFMDMLFDNLITDWVVQNKIKNALRNTEGTYDRVLRLVRTLENELKQEEKLINDLNAEKDQLLMS